MANRRMELRTPIFIVLVLQCAITCQTQTPAESRAASVLFGHFETVVYTRTDFVSQSSGDKSRYIDVDSVLRLRLPFLELVGGLRVLDPNAASAVVDKYGSILIGAKNFVSPVGLGMVSSQKCYIGVLDSGNQPNIDAFFNKATYESIEGRKVWTWSAQPYEGHPASTTFYAAQIGRSYFLMTNNRQGFKEISGALFVAQTSRTETAEVRGWETLKEHKYWAYRRLHRDQIVDSDASAGSFLSADVTSLAFFADIDRREAFILIFSSDPGLKTVPRVLSDSVPNNLHPIGPGSWQGSLPLSKNDGDNNAMYHLFYALGFGVSL